MPTAEEATRQAGDQKEGAMRQSGDADSGGATSQADNADSEVGEAQ